MLVKAYAFRVALISRKKHRQETFLGNNNIEGLIFKLGSEFLEMAFIVAYTASARQEPLINHLYYQPLLPVVRQSLNSYICKNGRTEILCFQRGSNDATMVN
jgi:hypothetical protein